MDAAPWWFFVASFAMSLFFGLCAIRIWPVQPQGHRPLWLVYQFWFNFTGSLAGWAALWVVVPKSWPTTIPDVTWRSAALSVVAFAGVTGHLPAAFVEGLVGIAALFRLMRSTLEKAADKVM